MPRRIQIGQYSGEYIINESYRPIAIELKKKFQELKHVPVESIIFIERQEEKPKHLSKKIYGKVSKISKRYNEIIYQLTGKEYEFILEIFKANILHMSKEQIIALLYHEMRHIQLIPGSGYRIVGHDIEDWSEMVSKLGLNWSASGKSIPDLLDDSITNWSSIENPQLVFEGTQLKIVK